MTPDESPCPWCEAAPGTLGVEFKLVADPIGVHAQNGGRLKVNARERPVLSCSSCHVWVPGDWDDTRHVVFDKRDVRKGKKD